MPTQIETYKKANDEFKQSVQNARAMAQVVSRGAVALDHWQVAMVSNCQGVFPPEVTLRQDAASQINASEWPSGQDIANTLRAYHSAWQRVKEFYAAIPATERAAVQSPTSHPPI